MLDHKWYPHLFDMVLGHLDWSDLRTMRLTSSAVNDKVCSIFYRHVVLVLPSNNKHRFHLVEPYHFDSLLLVDRSIPSSSRRRTAGTHPLGAVSLKEGLRRLAQYTRIIDFHGHTHAGHELEKILRSVIAGVKITREVSFRGSDPWLVPVARPPFAYTTRLLHHPVLFLNLKFYPHYDVLIGYDLVWTRGLAKPIDDEFLVVVNQTVRETCDCGGRSILASVFEEYEVFSVILARLKIWGGQTCSKTTFIKAKTPDIPTSQWDVVVDRLSQEWASRTSNSNREMTFSHTTPLGFQRSSGMSDFDLNMFTTIPGSRVPKPSVWLS